MAMLTYTKYKELSAVKMIEADFDRYINSAEDIISVVTRRFYEFNDFTTDAEWRKKAYLRAITEQVDFFGDMGAVTMEAIQAQPQSITIGRTTISKGVKGSVGVQEDRSLLSFGSELALQGTGLLYRGARR